MVRSDNIRHALAAWRAAALASAGDRRFLLARLLAPLAVLMIVAGLALAVGGYVFARQSDAAREAAQRQALIEEVRNAAADPRRLTTRELRALARNAGIPDLKLDITGSTGNRAVQPVLDDKGRIAAFLSWEAQRPMTDLMLRSWPIAAVVLALLALLGWMAVWQLRRALRMIEAAERRVETLERNDLLTGLPTQRRLLMMVEDALAGRPADEVAVFAHFNLDGFAEINDTLGHASGDDLLAAVAARIRELLPPRALAGRFGGDDFAVFVRGADADAAVQAIRDMATALSRPYWAAGRAMKVTVCAGFALCPRDADTRGALARCADLALRAAKRKGRSVVAGFEAAMDREFAERRFVETELKRALAGEELAVHYQPVMTSDGQRMTGVEALLRWTHPERGAIAPLEFVAVAEQSGLMSELGAFVLRRALADAARWPQLHIAVNLSPLQVRDPNLVAMVDDLLARHRIQPARLVLEVTEGVLIDNPDEAKLRLDALRALGVKIALDDFGTGYSSLGYLQRFKFDKLKIDRSFVAPLGRGGNSGVLVQAIVALARALDMTILAEGVETEEQRVLLRLAGCDEMQGFLFAEAVPRGTIDAIVAETRSRAGGPAALPAG
jgi:diguanylate cyclase (GGDEF)-like protein